MPRFIVLSFLVLGWAFYELSGGSDFEPRSAAMKGDDAAVEIAVQEPASDVTAPTPKLAVEAEKVAILQAEPEPSRPGEPSAEPSPARVARSGQTVPEDVGDAEQQVPVRASLSQGLALLPDAGPTSGITLIALNEGAAGFVARQDDVQDETDVGTSAEEVEFVEPEPDIREVIATRVNVRQGPGTIYPVVARVGLGREVEVLDDTGAGWLRLRVVSNDKVGWIASSLISKATN